MNMNLNLLYDALYVFFTMLEIMLFLYVVISWFPNSGKLRELFVTLLDPIFVPVRYLLKHSVFNTPRADLAPIISFVIILFLQEFFFHLKI
jgi:YggT family protein